VVELASSDDSLFARSPGLFDRAIAAGQDVQSGDPAGWFHHVTEPERASVAVHVPTDGLVLAHTCRGLVQRGDMLALIARDVVPDAP
jgi:predicted deacylase